MRTDTLILIKLSPCYTTTMDILGRILDNINFTI